MNHSAHVIDKRSISSIDALHVRLVEVVAKPATIGQRHGAPTRAPCNQSLRILQWHDAGCCIPRCVCWRTHHEVCKLFRVAAGEEALVFIAKKGHRCYE